MKLKRSYDNWTTREQLYLASSVLKSGDQNWMSVSRSLKAVVEKETSRPSDWFSQKSCAIQYAYLLENADTPKRKKRESGETTGESIVRRLTQERITELGQMLAFQREEYQQLKTEINMLRSGSITDDKLNKMWLAIEQEEREQEQKARAHSAWLAKRQQKQELNSPVSNISQRKSSENTVEIQETIENIEEDEKKARGGRSPLLTSLLKSPSPTTQIQTSTTTGQISSPTITSLLGSSPKVPSSQLTQNVSPQLHQLVTSAISNVPSERPSVGAPTLSMLLEMPANTQRGPLPNLQSTPTIVSQQNVTEIHNCQSQSVHQVTVQNETSVPQSLITTSNITSTESMVQIIDHIDDVIRKDIMADVIDKDEINEIIGDIEELIKEEITGSPQALDTATSTINTLTVPQIQEPVVTERPEPRDVDETVSLSNSPESEMAIEEIDSSTSNIAEIIGTVAIEPQEPKVIVANISETITNTSEEIKSEENTCFERMALKEELVPELNTQDSENSKDTPLEEKQIVDEFDTMDSTSNIETEENDSKIAAKELMDEIVEDEVEEEEETEVVVPEINKECSTNKLQRISSNELENKDNMELDQLEMHLAKITGEQQDVPSAEVVSVSSEITNDLPSTEDTEKSQDISLILEDDESSSDDKKKITEEQIIENTIESTESIESFKEEPIIVIKEKTIIEVSEESPEKSQEQTEEALEIYTDEFKKEDTKDSSEDTTSSILQDIEIKEEEIEETAIVEDSTQLVSPEDISLKIESVDPINTDTSIVKKEENTYEDSRIEEETKIQLENSLILEVKKEVQIKEEKEEKKNIDIEQNVKKESESIISAGEDTVELDEEESSLSKLSGGRAMKTYSKKQNASIDSEPETEGTGEGADYRAWKKAVMLVYNRLATHKYASVFLRPITEDQAPGYHSVIFRPMDLSTIKKNIDNGTIRSTMHFQRDVMLMFQNAIMYNKHDTFIYKMAVSMQEECLQHMQVKI